MLLGVNAIARLLVVAFLVVMFHLRAAAPSLAVTSQSAAETEAEMRSPTVPSAFSPVVAQPTNHRLEREAGDRLVQFWPLVELLQDFNQSGWLEVPLTLELNHCNPGPTESGAPSVNLGPRYLPSGDRLQICYGLLTTLEDHFDDLSASLPEQHLAVLDAVYLLVARELSRIVLTTSPQFRDWQPSPASPLAPEQPLNPEAPGPAGLNPSLDLFTVLLPQQLQQRSQTVLLSGSQWLFNQGQPRITPQQLHDWTGQSLDLDSYHRLVCGSYGMQPQQFPFLAAEIPQGWEIARCPVAAQALVASLGHTPQASERDPGK